MRNLWAAAIAFAALLTLVLMVPLPEGGRIVRASFDLLHAPAFAVLAVLVYGVLRGWLPGRRIWGILAVWILVSGFGGATELAQGPLGRNPSLEDFWANVAGAAAGTLWAASRTGSRALRIASVLGGGLLLLAGSSKAGPVLVDACLQPFEMPRLSSFENSLEISRWRERESHFRRERGHATHGDWALRVDLQPGLYPGVDLQWPAPDWSAYTSMGFDVYLSDDPPLKLAVKIVDARHKGMHYDGFHRVVQLSAGQNRIQIALSDVAEGPRFRRMDLGRIKLLQLFAVRLTAARTFYLDNVRLQ